jgi:hypothetical protein
MGMLKRQNGASFLGILIILAMVAALGLFGMKVLPLYLDYTSVSKAMDDMPGLAGLGKKGPKGIARRLNDQLYIDDVKTFNANNKEHFKVTKSKDGKFWVAAADYEARANYLKNIFIVIHFQKTVEVPR